MVRKRKKIIKNTDQELDEKKEGKAKRFNLKVKIKKAHKHASSKISDIQPEKSGKKYAVETDEGSNYDIGEQSVNAVRRADDEKIERGKRMIMWSGVAFFMILISFFWLYNLKQVMKKNTLQDKGQFSWEEWNKLTEDVSQKMDKIKAELSEIKSQPDASKQGTSTIFNFPASASSSEEIIATSSQSELKQKLQELEKSLQPSE